MQEFHQGPLRVAVPVPIRPDPGQGEALLDGPLHGGQLVPLRLQQLAQIGGEGLLADPQPQIGILVTAEGGDELAGQRPDAAVELVGFLLRRRTPETVEPHGQMPRQDRGLEELVDEGHEVQPRGRRVELQRLAPDHEFLLDPCEQVWPRVGRFGRRVQAGRPGPRYQGPACSGRGPETVAARPAGHPRGRGRPHGAGCTGSRDCPAGPWGTAGSG